MSCQWNDPPLLLEMSRRSALRCVVTACAVSASACGTRTLLPTLSLHAVLVLRQGALDARPKASNDFALQAQLSFRPRGRPHPRLPQGTAPLPMSMPLAVAPDCQQAVLCEWAELAEESTLSALGVSP
jgi:hypothetical protein